LMGESIRRVYEPGRWLLVAGIILSVVLMLQLYAINETVDIGSIDTLLGRNMTGLMLVASYILTTMAMLVVVSEYFQTKKRMDGLFALTDLLDRVQELQAVGSPRAPAQTTVAEPTPSKAPQKVVEPLVDAPEEFTTPEQTPPAAMEAEAQTGPATDSAVAELKKDGVSYKTIEVKVETDEAPLSGEPKEEELDFDEIDELSQQRFLNADDEEEKVDELLKHSEVISTLNELERVVEELKSKRGVFSPQ
jgi:hypothetical protein